MNNAEKKGLAKDLYMSTNWTQKAIAQHVKVTQKTLSKWKEEGKWEVIKSATLASKDKIVAHYMRMISQILEKAEAEERYITLGETDQIAKMTKAKESFDKEIGLSVFIQVFDEYSKFLLLIDPKLAKENIVHQDKFINLKASGK